MTHDLPHPRTFDPLSAPVFIGLGVVLFSLSSLAPQFGLFAALALFLLGVPHGAVERHPVSEADPSRGIRRTLPTLGYTALYLVVALLVFCSWLLGPLPTLGLFLALSAVHFSQAEPRLRLAGPWVVTGSLLLFAEPTLFIFGTLTQTELIAPVTVATAQAVGATVALALLVEGLIRRDVGGALTLLLAFLLLPPVEAVALYYFASHSLREWREALAQRGSAVALIRLYAPFAVPVLLGGSAIIALTALGRVELFIAAGLAIAIATPHMLPFERWVAASRGTPAEGTGLAAH